MNRIKCRGRLFKGGLALTLGYCRSNWSVPQILIQYITSGWPINFIKFLEIFIHFLWKSQFQEFDHFWSLPFYLWLVSCTNNKGDWCIQTIQQEVYNYTRKCMNISRNLIKWIGQPEVMYWINIWGTLQLGLGGLPVFFGFIFKPVFSV
jgi:hypothetical protein